MPAAALTHAAYCDGARSATASAGYSFKDAALYGDDPSHAFSLTPPEAFRRAAQAEQGHDAEMIWDGALRRALTIVRIGLANMPCRIIGAQFQSELPDAVNGMLNSYGMSISLYVSQFPEIGAV